MYKLIVVNKTISNQQEFNPSYCEMFWVAIICHCASGTHSIPLWGTQIGAHDIQYEEKNRETITCPMLRKAGWVSVWASKPCWKRVKADNTVSSGVAPGRFCTSHPCVKRTCQLIFLIPKVCFHCANLFKSASLNAFVMCFSLQRKKCHLNIMENLLPWLNAMRKPLNTTIF